MKRKESLFKYLIIVLLVAMLFLIMLPKRVKAVGYGLLGEVGMQVSNTDITKVNLNLKNNITYSSNLSPWFSNGEGTGVERDIALNTLYEITATNAFTHLGQPLNLKISFKPIVINDRCFLKISNGKTSNLELVLANFDSIVEITYTITNSSGQVVDYDFCYGFGDPDGGDYLFNNVENADIYYTPSAATAGNLAFANAFNVTSEGILIVSNQSGFQSDGFIYISDNSETSTFNITWSTTSDNNRPNMYDYLVLPGLYYEPVRLDIKINMNGGQLLPNHGPTIGYIGDLITVNNSSTIHTMKMNEALATNGLVDYNNTQFVNIGRVGYHVNQGSEYFSYDEDNHIQYFNQTAQYAASDFVSDLTHSAIKELFVNWIPNEYSISYTLNGGTYGAYHPNSGTYDSILNISNPTRVGYTFTGWTMTNGNTSTAMYGTTSTNVTSAWSNASTKITAEYFKNLRDTAGTVTLVANWTVNTYEVIYNGNGGTQLVNSNLLGKYDGYFNNGNSHSTSTTSWLDISGNNKNGTITNGTWGADHIVLDGTTWVNLGQMNSNYQTIEATFSIDALKSTSQYIIGNWESGGGGMYVTSAGVLTGEFYIGGAWKRITSPEVIIPQKIYHVALTYDGTTERLYVNGVEKGYLSISGTIGTPSNSTIMAMGGNPARSTVSSPTFTGKIYNAAVYNTALTATQIANDGGKVVTYGSTYGTLPDAARAGCTFKGWYNQPSGGTKITSSSTVSTAGNHILYAQWDANTSTITIKKDNSNWTSGNSIQVTLYQNGTPKYEYNYGDKSGATITWEAVVAGTYDIYASKDANNLTTLVDTGVDVTVSSTGTETIDYYTLTLNKGVGISAVSGAGTYLKNQAANIDATVATGYTWQGWSVVLGDSPN